MGEKLDASAAKALDKITNGLDQMVSKIGTLTEKYGPEVVDAGLSVVRVTGVSNVLSNLAGAVILGVVAYATYRICKHRLSKLDDDQDWTDVPEIIIPGTIVMMFSSIPSLICTIHLLDVWNWVAIFEPKLWVAKKLLGF